MQAYLRLLRYLRPHLPIVVGTWAISAVLLLLQGASVWVAAEFVHGLLTGSASPTHHATHALHRLLDGLAASVLARQTPFRSLLSGVTFLVLCGVATAALRFAKLTLFARVNYAILYRLRTELFDRLTSAEKSFTDRRRPGALLSVMVEDIDQLYGALIDAADRIAMQPARLLLAIALLATISPVLTVWMLLAIAGCGLFVHAWGARSERMASLTMEHLAEFQGRLAEYLSTALLARALGREPEERQKFAATCKQLEDSQIGLHVVNGIAGEVVELVALVGGAILLVTGGYAVLAAGTMPAGDLLRMALLLPMVTYSVRSLALLGVSVRGSTASAKRIFALLDDAAATSLVPTRVVPVTFQRHIRLTHVEVSIDGHDILRNVDLEIPHGATVILHGPSGAGKTTLLYVLAGFVRPTAGSVWVDGHALEAFDPAAWRRNIGFVEQDPMLLNDTVRENLLYAVPNTTDDRLIEVLRRVHLWGHGDGLPGGLDTVVGNRGEMLSGGQRQRLALARALLSNPPILLLDEPTAMLDEHTGAAIRDLLRGAAAGRTVIIASHDPAIHDIADRTVHVTTGVVRPAMRWAGVS